MKENVGKGGKYKKEKEPANSTDGSNTGRPFQGIAFFYFRPLFLLDIVEAEVIILENSPSLVMKVTREVHDFSNG